MKCSVFIATSLDGYIATSDGSVDWLQQAGIPDVDLRDNPDLGFQAYLRSVDCLIMGRKTMETVANMNLSPEQWPYGDIPIIVLSRTLEQPPETLPVNVEIHSGEIPELIKQLKENATQHAYIDGGRTITEFLNLNLIDEITLTKAPILLGEGIPLFGNLSHQIKLRHLAAEVFPNDFVQMNYEIIR